MIGRVSAVWVASALILLVTLAWPVAASAQPVVEEAVPMAVSSSAAPLADDQADPKDGDEVSAAVSSPTVDIEDDQADPPTVSPGQDIWEPLVIPEPEKGTGSFQLTVETLQEKTPRMYSLRAEHVEIWWRDRRLASLYKGDAGVLEAFHRRIFTFPRLDLPSGYHFLEIRLYGEGQMSRNQKWKGQMLQIGIHPDRVILLRRKIPFHVW